MFWCVWGWRNIPGPLQMYILIPCCLRIIHQKVMKVQLQNIFKINDIFCDRHQYKLKISFHISKFRLISLIAEYRHLWWFPLLYYPVYIDFVNQRGVPPVTLKEVSVDTVSAGVYDVSMDPFDCVRPKMLSVRNDEVYVIFWNIT